MNLDKFAQQIDQVRQRTETLDQHVSESPSPRQDLLAQALGRLKVALEELHSAEEELLVQSEELANAHKVIEQERQRYQELFDFAPDGYLVTDCEGKILEANRAACDLLKVSKQSLTSKLVISFIINEDRRAFRTQLLQLCNMRQIQEWEVRLQPHHGEQFCCSINVTTVFDHEDNPLGLRWLLRDITARKQAEEQLHSIQLQNLQLQEATRIKSQFMSVVSHELRTPMNAILGFSQLLLRRYYHLFPPELRTMVEKIINSGKQLLALIEDILDFSALEAGRVDLQPQEFNLADLVTTTTQQLQFLANQKNLTLAVHVELKDPLIVNDSDRIRQVLVNLLSNAIKFTYSGGILIELQELHQDQLAMTVRDTGIGIPESELKNIFQGFWQLNQSTTRKYGGTGLGLAIVDKLLHLMNGTITVDSKENEGSTFRVVLPRQVTTSPSK